MRFKVQYLSGSRVVYESELDGRNAREAAVSAQIGMRWAKKEHRATGFQVLDEQSDIVALDLATTLA